MILLRDVGAIVAKNWLESRFFLCLNLYAVEGGIRVKNSRVVRRVVFIEGKRILSLKSEQTGVVGSERCGIDR